MDRARLTRHMAGRLCDADLTTAEAAGVEMEIQVEIVSGRRQSRKQHATAFKNLLKPELYNRESGLAES